MKKQLIRWYVVPHTPDVNARIAMGVDGRSFLFNGELKVRYRSGVFREKPVWEVPRFVINALNADRQARGKFTVCVQRGNGEVREFDPHRRPRKAIITV